MTCIYKRYCRCYILESSLKSPSPNNDSPWHCLIPPPVLFIFSGRCYWLRIILYKLGLFCGCCVLSSLWVFFLLLLQIWSRTSVALLKFVYTNSTYTGIRSVIWHQLEPLYNRKQRWVVIDCHKFFFTNCLFKFWI